MWSLDKIFALYTVAFLGITVLIGIGERIGLFSNQMIGWLFMALSLAIYVVIGVLTRTSNPDQYYVAGRNEKKTPFADYLARHARAPASGRLHEQPFFLKPPLDLDRSRRSAARPLAVLFEQSVCAACDELHREGFAHPDVRALVRRFDVARLELFGKERLTTPQGRSLSAEQWGRELKVAYAPTLVFFDEKGVESFRVEAYLRPFHLASSLDYIASGAYRKEPSFQRYIQSRAEAIRATGGRVDLW